MPYVEMPAAVLFGLLGLLVGSFLNVVIHRLPLILQRRWAAECASLPDARDSRTLTEPFNLVVPSSRCPHCARPIRWFENIPIVSYIALRGRCVGCYTPIGIRYPLIEALSAALFALCGWRWGLSPEALAWSGFAAALLSLAAIDWDTTLLPDDITLPLVWVGLCAAALNLTAVGLSNALWGAVGGYLCLWIVFWAFKLVTGKEGMGYGDFKLFAALGAWFGWTALVPMILIASVIGAVFGVAMKIRGQLREGGYVPFGPFLALAGLTALVFGPRSMLAVLGL